MADSIAVGRVSTYFPERGTATVLREDIGLITDELTITKRTDNWEPAIGEYVLCVFLPRSSSAGYILGGV